MDKPTLQGEMLVLRPLRPQDADGMWEIVSDPEARRMSGTAREWTRALERPPPALRGWPIRGPTTP